MSSNILQSQVRMPRGRVTANGSNLRFESFRVTNTANHKSDTFEVTLPLFDPQAPFDWKWWASQTQIEIIVSMGQQQGDGSVGSYTTLITGPVEKISMEPVPEGHSHEGGHEGGEGQKLVISGRDYTGQLIDSRMDQQFAGSEVTDQQIIGQIQSNHPQLTITVQGGSNSDAIGDPYNELQHRLMLNRSEWDVLTALADHEGLRITTRGRTITLAPPGSSDGSGSYSIFFQPASSNQPMLSNCEHLDLMRNLQIGKGVKANVQSFDSKSGKAHASQSTAGGSGDDTPVTYNHNVPGMTKKQSSKHATSKADQISKFEREINFTIPGDTTLTAQSMISLSGTGTAFDQSYYVDQLVHHHDVRVGYTMVCRARNRSSDSSVSSSSDSGGGGEDS